MSTSTKDILIEITSENSIDLCKKIMEELLLEMLRANLVSKADDLNKHMQNLNVSNNPNEKIDTNASGDDSIKIKNSIVIQQVRIVDSKGQLKTVYPSRVDLVFNELLDKIKVVRLYDEEKN